MEEWKRIAKAIVFHVPIMLCTMLRLAIALPLATLATLLTACGGPTTPVAPPNQTTPQAATSPTEPVAVAPAVPTEEVKLMKEFWDTGKLKYWNEMRKDSAGKWQKTGLGRAYYSDGILEREGMYKDGTRVGIWKYYDDAGNLARTEDRGEGKPGGA